MTKPTESTTPKDLDGIESAKANIRFALQGIRSFADDIEEIVDLPYQSLSQHAKAMAGRALDLVSAAGALDALMHVRFGTYRDPKEGE
jgi:hypothetical protein